MRTFNKATAWFVILAFVTLLQVSAMPLRAKPAPAAAETSVSSPEQGPGVIEEEGAPPAGAKKKSIVPLVLIGLGVAAAVVLALVVLKSSYDITGSWTFVMTGTSSGANNVTWNPVTFSGDKKSGTYQVETFYDGKGNYTVDGKNVTMTSSYYTNWTWTGKFTDKNAMSGTSTWNTGTNTLTWSWTATRAAGSAALPPSTASGTADSILRQLLGR
ncbi:MAG TPA: hypothetical protein PK919_09730 [Candidatus Aminicenantes bacterium]|nr:hypothetical protein [Candidatus Aminicenantes bacterium]